MTEQNSGVSWKDAIGFYCKDTPSLLMSRADTQARTPIEMSGSLSDLSLRIRWQS